MVGRVWMVGVDSSRRRPESRQRDLRAVHVEGEGFVLVGRVLPGVLREELSTTIATGEKDLASATEIREKEKADFDKLEKELMEAVSMLERAYGIIEREMSKTGFIQSKASKESM